MSSVDRSLWPAIAGYAGDIPALNRTILERAWRDCEIAETPPGSNHGVRVELYLRRAGASAGDPWCAAWVGAVFRDAGAAVPEGYAACRNWVPWAQARGLWLPADATPPVGAAVLYHAAGQPSDHIGIVVRWDQWYRRSIEGNTSIDGFSREGTLVAFKTISLPRVLGYVRPEPA